MLCQGGRTKIKMSSELREKLVEHPITFGVIGPIGAGKSTISKVLGDRLKIPVIEEKFAQNPFLKDFYAKPKDWSYKSQTWFLIEKVKQLKELDYTKSQIIDPALEMDLIYAQTLQKIGFMEDREFDQYKGLFEELYRVKKPDVFLVITAPPEVLEKRIKERARTYELVMLKKYPSYLANLRRNVEEFQGKIIYVNSKDNNFTDENNIDELVDELKLYM